MHRGPPHDERRVSVSTALVTAPGEQEEDPHAGVRTLPCRNGEDDTQNRVQATNLQPDEGTSKTRHLSVSVETPQLKPLVGGTQVKGLTLDTRLTDHKKLREFDIIRQKLSEPIRSHMESLHNFSISSQKLNFLSLETYRGLSRVSIKRVTIQGRVLVGDGTTGPGPCPSRAVLQRPVVTIRLEGSPGQLER